MPTTTSIFQNTPDFYTNKEDCNKQSQKHQTNPRYKNFTQTIFHAGDIEQFDHYRDATNNLPLLYKQIQIPENNLFFNTEIYNGWIKYNNVKAITVANTFSYIFHKFKKGIFVKIKNNELSVFLPFSKANFTNEWSNNIKINPSYAKYNKNQTPLINFMQKVATIENKRDFDQKKVNINTSHWYGNNCLIRYEYPVNETETNVNIIKNFLEELCKNRNIPDIEFFINKRDFPLLKKDSTEPYNHIFDTENQPLLSHNYDKYIPILSMSNNEKYADQLFPTVDDWARVQYKENIYFPKLCRDYTDNFTTPWEQKKNIAVFRGSTTGCGLTINTNQRIKLLYIVEKVKPEVKKLFDVGITNWNARPRKVEGFPYLQTLEDIELQKIGMSTTNLLTSNKLTAKQQSEYKYIIHIDGHVTAYRLSLELAMGSVILKVDSPYNYKLWYGSLLIPFEHYIPIKSDMSDLIEKVHWCMQNNEKCKMIANNAKQFYNTYLQKNGIFDYMQKLLINIKDNMGEYLYNEITPLDQQLKDELEYLENTKYFYPTLQKTVDNYYNNISSIPQIPRCIGLLNGVNYLINSLRKELTDKFFIPNNTITNSNNITDLNFKSIFTNKLSTIYDFTLANFSFILKTTEDNQKIKEHIHETFIGLNCINNLLKNIPNFSYIFGLVDSKYIISEKIHGQTFLEYLNSSDFDMKTYLNILLQISLAIQVAQNNYCFVHYDLTPWNIMLQKTSEPIVIDYVLTNSKVIRIKTDTIPVIIDYGKSHATINNKHYGFVNMYKFSSVQDILTLLLTSLDVVLNKQNLEKEQLSETLYLANFISDNQYCPDKFKSVKDLKLFISKSKKYTELITSNKYELEQKTPLDLLKYILKLSHYKFSVGFTKDYENSLMNKGNGKQVFEYILSKTKADKINSFKNVLYKIKQSTIPQPNNVFLLYYSYQNIYQNLESVYVMFNNYIDSNLDKTEKIKFEKIYKSVTTFLHKVFMTKLASVQKLNITDYGNELRELTYTINKDDYTILEIPEYDQETFLEPDKILEIIKKYKRNSQEDKEDANTNNKINITNSYFYFLIQDIFLNKGKYKLPENILQYYSENFKNILSLNPIHITNNNANKETIFETSNKIYKYNKEKILEESLDLEKIPEVKIYDEIINLSEQ